VENARRLGLRVIVDLHQDAYSRYLRPGCGEGFPAWTVPDTDRAPARAAADCSPFWGVQMALTPAMHAAFRSLYAAGRTRAAYIRLWARVAAHFKSQPAVIGYDILNEPWGDEAAELAPLYRDVAREIHKADPGAIVFVESRVFPVSFGWAGTKLPRPDYAPFAYAPHYYDPLVIASNRWSPLLKGIEGRGLRKMAVTAASWNAPLFVGELGVTGATRDPGPFMEFQYARLAASFASWAQWSYSPNWTPDRKDGWNGEDTSIVDEKGRLKAFFPLMPGAQAIGGRPLAQKLARGAGGELTLELKWEDSGKNLATEVYAPPPAARWSMKAEGADLRCAAEAGRPVIACRSAVAGEKSLRLTEKQGGG
jgi:endoglycosylceramidase